MDLRESPEEEGAVASMDLAKAFHRVQLIMVWRWAMHCGLPQRVLGVLRGHFAHEQGTGWKNYFSVPMFVVRLVLLQVETQRVGSFVCALNFEVLC